MALFSLGLCVLQLMFRGLICLSKDLADAGTHAPPAAPVIRSGRGLILA